MCLFLLSNWQKDRSPESFGKLSREDISYTFLSLSQMFFIIESFDLSKNSNELETEELKKMISKCLKTISNIYVVLKIDFPVIKHSNKKINQKEESLTNARIMSYVIDDYLPLEKRHKDLEKGLKEKLHYLQKILIILGYEDIEDFFYRHIK